MSRKERLTKEIDWLREKRKDWFTILFALISAIVVLVYAVITGEKPIYFLIIAVTGLIVLLIVAVMYKRIEAKIEQRLTELEKEE